MLALPRPCFYETLVGRLAIFRAVLLLTLPSDVEDEGLRTIKFKLGEAD
jgi:hypothetical protein